MEAKGLCVTCVQDKDCTFPRQFPVLQCEEFDAGETKSTKVKKTSRQTRNISTFEETPEE